MRELYLAHADAVRRFVRSRVRDDFEAADIVHDTMLAVWRNASGFQQRASVRTWILSIARNKTLDHIRKQSRVKLAEPDETIPDDDPSAETVIGAAQDAARVRACVDELSEAHRAAVHLAFFEDMTCAEIAEVEQVPAGTIKTRIYHAKKLIMRCLERCIRKD
ncbi:MAG: sigma-70 family RNA polymerase sigma factor [Pseudomonadota bacterium]